jgi:hypothetical protein
VFELGDNDEIEPGTYEKATQNKFRSLRTKDIPPIFLLSMKNSPSIDSHLVKIITIHRPKVNQVMAQLRR